VISNSYLCCTTDCCPSVWPIMLRFLLPPFTKFALLPQDHRGPRGVKFAVWFSRRGHCPDWANPFLRVTPYNFVCSLRSFRIVHPRKHRQIRYFRTPALAMLVLGDFPERDERDSPPPPPSSRPSLSTILRHCCNQYSVVVVRAPFPQTFSLEVPPLPSKDSAFFSTLKQAFAECRANFLLKS